VITRVVRKTALGTAIFLEIPLLKGESVTSEDIRVEKGNALINIASNQSEITWMSVLEKQETITLLLAIAMAPVLTICGGMKIALGACYHRFGYFPSQCGYIV